MESCFSEKPPTCVNRQGYLVKFQFSQMKGKKDLHLYINIHSRGKACLPHSLWQLFKWKWTLLRTSGKSYKSRLPTVPMAPRAIHLRCIPQHGLANKHILSFKELWSTTTVYWSYMKELSCSWWRFHHIPEISRLRPRERHRLKMKH